MLAESEKLNLIMVFRPEFVDPTDYQKIRKNIQFHSNRVRVHIVPDNILSNKFPDIPTLTFCPSILRVFRPPRGHVFSGKVIPKSEQMRLLAKNGVRVPKWSFLDASQKYGEADWGPLVIVKPNAFGAASGGKGIELVRTTALRYKPPIAYPAGHPGRQDRMIVQKFVETGDFSEDHRVVTMFGRTLYALRRKSLIKLERPVDSVPTTVGVVSNATASGQREVHLCYDKDVLDFASKIYRAIPDVPFQAVDIRRESGTGMLYCLEINPGGNTWNFSSARAREVPTIDGLRREDQFGAWEIAAKTLIEVTHKFAS
jgi:hypothetical protein